MQKTFAIDLDGTLAKYTDFKGEEHIGKPVEKSVKRIKNWFKNGHKVAILTARVSSKKDLKSRNLARRTIREWLIKVFGEKIGNKIEITAEKSPEMYRIYDDRVTRVKRNSGEKFKLLYESIINQS